MEHKLDMTADKAKILLQAAGAGTPESVQRLHSGENSTAFIVDQQYVLRINRDAHGFRNDMFAALHFCSPEVPVPQVVTAGVDEDTHFALTHLVPGHSLYEEPLSEELLTEYVATLHRIRDTDVSATSGYGPWDENGKGKFQTWRESIRSRADSLDIEALCQTTFLERELCDALRTEIARHIDVVPETEVRTLIHGDLHGNNLLVNNNHIVGVIDWAQAAYGDYLYDIADADLWTQVPVGLPSLKEKATQDYANEKRVVPHLEERIRCYQLLIALEVFCFYAQTQQLQKYDYLKSIVFEKGLLPDADDGHSRPSWRRRIMDLIGAPLRLLSQFRKH